MNYRVDGEEEHLSWWSDEVVDLLVMSRTL